VQVLLLAITESLFLNACRFRPGKEPNVPTDSEGGWLPMTG